MAVALSDINVAAAIEPQLVRHVQRGCCGGPAVAAIAALAAAGDGGQPLRQEIETPDALIVEVAEIQRAIWTDDEPYGLLTWVSE